MYYLKVKKQYDQQVILTFFPHTQLKKNRVLVEDELITINEATSEGVIDELKNKYAELVLISKNDTFKINGYRFEVKKI
tara:strand:+ start:302 stop:538 length:237 start_codon:yes stop_codon:yes gene_type:complete